jgi:hypothetical protein
MPHTRSQSVPNNMQAAYAAIVALLDPFCAQHLNEEYAQLGRELAAALARKRPSPLARGKPEIWACGIVYALGTVNFLFDASQKPHMRADALCAAFGVSQSSGSNKARQIREMFGMYQFDPNWCLPSLIDQNPMVWMLQVDGLMVDVRQMSREVQAAAFQKGLIPYIPADRRAQPRIDPPAPEPASLQRYRQYRAAQVELNDKIVNSQMSQPTFDAAARALGVSGAGRQLLLDSEDQISVIMDYAIYEVGKPGTRVIDLYRERSGSAAPIERELLEAMTASAVGVYRVESFDEPAGRLLLKQLAPVERELLLTDISLSRSRKPGVVMFTRLFELPEFAMTGGAALLFKAALEANVVRLWAETAPGARYGEIFKLHRRRGVPITYASVS